MLPFIMMFFFMCMIVSLTTMCASRRRLDDRNRALATPPVVKSVKKYNTRPVPGWNAKGYTATETALLAQSDLFRGKQDPNIRHFNPIIDPDIELKPHERREPKALSTPRRSSETQSLDDNSKDDWELTNGICSDADVEEEATQYEQLTTAASQGTRSLTAHRSSEEKRAEKKAKKEKRPNITTRLLGRKDEHKCAGIYYLPTLVYVSKTPYPSDENNLRVTHSDRIKNHKFLLAKRRKKQQDAARRAEAQAKAAKLSTSSSISS